MLNQPTIPLVNSKCHKCGRNRPTTGIPGTCLGCIRHYQKNLAKRAARQAKANTDLTPEAQDRRDIIQAMFQEALAEEMGKQGMPSDVNTLDNGGSEITGAAAFPSGE